jgi:DNA-binding winged helix-turn-helix (wHTH) protein
MDAAAIATAQYYEPLTRAPSFPMPHLLVMDIDDSTLASLVDFVSRRAGREVMSTESSHREVPLAFNAERPAIASLELFAAATLDPAKSIDPKRGNGRAAPHASSLLAPSDPLTVHSRVTLLFGGWRLEPARRALWSASGALIGLSSREYELLFTLAKHPQRALTRQQIINLMRGNDRPTHPRSVDVYVSRLRQKVEVDPHHPQIIQTVRNGYVLGSPVTLR